MPRYVLPLTQFLALVPNRWDIQVRYSGLHPRIKILQEISGKITKWPQYLNFGMNTVYSWHITVVYITELDILQSYVGPHFLAPKTQYFSWNRGNSLDPIRERQFFAKFVHCDRLCSRSAGDNFSWNSYSSLPVNGGWNTCCAVVSHAKRSIDTSIVSQSRVQLIKCQCKSRLQIVNLGINNAFLIKSSLFDHTVYIRHLVQTLGQIRSESRACYW